VEKKELKLPRLLVALLYFLQSHKTKQKIQKSHQATAPKKATMDRQTMTEKEQRRHNI
jgi:hypothetical protein